jgi:pilus assembly protein CpaC
MTVGTNVRKRTCWTAIFILVILVTATQAQQRQVVSYSSDGTPVTTTSTRTIDLLVGRSAVLNLSGPISRISLTVPEIADALVTAPQEILIHGKTPGTISLFIWEKTGAILTYEVTVRRDLGVLANQLVQLFPGEPIQVTGSSKDVVLSGRVSSQYIVEKAAEVAVAYAEKKENVVNLLKLQEGIASNQVLLKVRFAEVSRSAVQELGASLFTGAGGFHDYVARTATQQFAAPSFDTMTRDSIQGVEQWGGGRDTVTATGGQQTFSDFLNLFLFNNRLNIGALVRAMQSKGVFQSLAEPNLVATDGKEASFLAGGEYPYPVVQGSNQGTSVSIQFKEFGVRLKFTPTMLGGDLINLKIEPEVSALDFSNAVTIQGFRIPALSTRRTQTEIELHDGQTFAVAGLLNNTAVTSMRKIPGIGDIPILGLLFKSRAYEKQATELVVMITPQILRRNSTGASQALPNLIEPFLPPPVQSFPPPPPYVGSPRDGAAQPGKEGSVEPQPSTPAAIAATSPAAVPAMTKEEARKLEAARKAAQQQRELEARRQAEAEKAAAKAAAEQKKRQELEAKAAAKKAEEDKRTAEAAAREQAKKDAAAAKKAAEDKRTAEAAARAQATKDVAAARKAAEDKRTAEEQQKKQAAEEEKRRKALAEAAAKVTDAQRAYDALVRPPKAS